MRGRYSCNQGEVGAELALDRGQGAAITGTFSVFGLDPATTPGAARGVTPSRHRLSGSLEPLTGVVELQAGEWIGTPGRDGQSSLRGVYLDGKGILLGRLMLGTRPNPQCTTLIASRDKDAYQLPAPAGTAGELAQRPLSCDLLGDWARRLTREYPGMDVPNTEVSLLSERATPLFHGREATQALVWRSRALERWRAEILARLQQLPASPEGFVRAREP